MSKKEKNLLENLKNRAQQSNKIYSDDKSIQKEWEVIPITLATKLTFGKYYGESILDIVNKDFQYIIWLFTKKLVVLDKSNLGLYTFSKRLLDQKYKELTNQKLNK